MKSKVVLVGHVATINTGNDKMIVVFYDNRVRAHVRVTGFISQAGDIKYIYTTTITVVHDFEQHAELLNSLWAQ